MNSFIKRLWFDLVRIWDGLGQTQRIVLGGILASTLAGLVALVVWSQAPDFQPLYANLEDADAGAVIAELQTAQIPYQVSPDGRRISVPAGRVAEVRLQMAQKGLPTGGGQLGFEELFDKGGTLGQTDALMRLNARRGLQGELARTIKQMSTVETARVTLAVPEPSLYADNDASTEPSATVLLKLKTGKALTPEQARTIVHLVAGSVERMKPQNVLVADTAGHNYSEDLNLGDDSALMSAGQLETKRSYESAIRKNLQAMLDRVLGLGNSVVQVQADFDFNRIEVNQEIFQPILQAPDGTRSGLLRSQRESIEEYQGRAPAIAGAPGTTTNIPTYQASDSQGNDGNYRRSDVTRNYEVNKEIKRQTKPPAELRRLSVSVAVNGEIPEEQRQSMQDMISAAAGIDPNRGDTLVVAAIPFNDKAAKDAEAEILAESERTQLLDLAKIVGAVLVALVALFLLRRGLRAREDELLATLQTPAEKAGINVAEIVLGEEDRRTHLQREISKVVKAQPQEVARLVRTWMLEDDR